jgi:hypothetical protein
MLFEGAEWWAKLPTLCFFTCQTHCLGKFSQMGDRPKMSFLAAARGVSISNA